MVWADRSGTIGWQAVGIAPIRRNFSGLIPVPGDGRYEWDGFLPIKAKPHLVNPPQGYFATANNDLIPRDYPCMDAIGYSWADPYRWDRLNEVLGGGRKMSVADMERLQTDEHDYFIRLIEPHEVLDIVPAMQAIDKAWIREKYLMHCHGAWPEYGEEDVEYTWEYFQLLRDFFARMAGNGRAILFTADQ